MNDREPDPKRRVPEVFSHGADHCNSQKAWLDGYDTAYAELSRLRAERAQPADPDLVKVTLTLNKAEVESAYYFRNVNSIHGQIARLIDAGDSRASAPSETEKETT